MLAPATIRYVENYWAAYFGCPVKGLRVRGAVVLERQSNSSAWVFGYGEALVWHVPRRFAAAAIEAAADARFNEGCVRAIFGRSVTRLIGPCPIAYCDEQSFRRSELRHHCRILGNADQAELERLAADCGEDWGIGGIEPALHPVIVGCFESDRLVAAASYETWGDAIAHLCVVTAPDRRGRGFATAAAGCAAAEAMRRGLVPQWRTLGSNTASLAVARSLGFVAVASHFFVELTEAAPSSIRAAPGGGAA